MRSLFILLSLSLVTFSVFSKCYRYGSGDERVDFFYNEVLDRSRDYSTGEGSCWKHALNSGSQKWAKVCEGFMLSPEYQNKGKSDSEFLTDLYRVILNRKPDAKGFDDNLWYLGRQSRHTLLYAFCNSPEGQSLMSDENGKGCEHNYCRKQQNTGDSTLIEVYKNYLTKAINKFKYSYDINNIKRGMACNNDMHFHDEIEGVLDAALNFIEANEKYYSRNGSHYTHFSKSYWSMKYEIQSAKNDLDEFMSILNRIKNGSRYLADESKSLGIRVVNRTSEIASFSLGSY